MKKTFYGILLMFVILGCKEEKTNVNSETTSSDNETVETVLPNKLKLEVDLTTSHPDEFKLFANDVYLNNDQSMNLSISQELSSNETSKKMTFEFPENIQPDVLLGFNLGTKTEKEVQINTMSLSYGNTNFSITPQTLEEYFTYNQFVEIDANTNTITTKKVDNRLNPMLLVRRKILDSILKVN